MKSINPTCSEPTKVEKYLEKNTLVFFKQEKKSQRAKTRILLVMLDPPKAQRT